MVTEVKYNSKIYAIILSFNHLSKGIEFFTPDDFSLQLGYMNWPEKHEIPPHVHKPLSREIFYTKEVLFIKSGKVRVDFYSDDKKYFGSKILKKGDFILLAFGGHGFKMLEASEIIEVKQGPYLNEKDKERFEGIDSKKVIYLKDSSD